MSNFSDSPITTPDMDIYGLNNFAKSMANAIIHVQDNESVVFSLNGKWGTGKSSTINLIKHHIHNNERTNFTSKEFKCWWIRGEEQILLHFFHTLHSMLKESTAKRAMKYVKEIAQFCTKLKKITSYGANAISPALGGASDIAFDLLGSFLNSDRSMDQAYQELKKELKKSEQKFLIIIDDIDRLSPHESLLIFQLVKTVGNLPNISYLLALDKDLAESNIAEYYKTNGSLYLDKIIQINFDVPSPTKQDLDDLLASKLKEIQKAPPNREAHTTDIYSYIQTLRIVIQSPRDLNKFCNTLYLTWNAVGEELDFFDFAVLECTRIFKPSLYSFIQSRKNSLIDIQSTHGVHEKIYKDDIEKYTENDNYTIQTLSKLFPSIDLLYRPEISTSPSIFHRKERRICNEDFFDSYFFLSLRGQPYKAKDIKSIINVIKETNTNKIKSMILEKCTDKESTVCFLKEMTANLIDIDAPTAKQFIESLFSVADSIHYENKARSEFKTFQALAELVFTILLQFDDTKTRDSIIKEAATESSILWLEFLISVLQSKSPYMILQKARENSSYTSNTQVISPDTFTSIMNCFESRIINEIEKSLDGDPYFLNPLLYAWDQKPNKEQWIKSKHKNKDFVVALSRILLSLLNEDIDIFSAPNRYTSIVSHAYPVDILIRDAQDILTNEKLTEDERNTLTKLSQLENKTEPQPTVP